MTKVELTDAAGVIAWKAESLRHGAFGGWKDYRIKGRDRQKTMTLSVSEFIRRFLYSRPAAGEQTVVGHIRYSIAEYGKPLINRYFKRSVPTVCEPQISIRSSKAPTPIPAGFPPLGGFERRPRGRPTRPIGGPASETVHLTRQPISACLAISQSQIADY